MSTIDRAQRLLLISNSTLHRRGYLDHAEKEIRDLVADRRNVIFIPYALRDRRAYAEKATNAFAKWASRSHLSTMFPISRERSMKRT
jgi:peptidase E